jgi:hypothetical protein
MAANVGVAVACTGAAGGVDFGVWLTGAADCTGVEVLFPRFGKLQAEKLTNNRHTQILIVRQRFKDLPPLPYPFYIDNHRFFQ